MQRLRSEWSSGIFRQSSDEKTGVNRQTYDGGGSGGRQLSSDSDDSCRRLAHASYVIRPDSDSDSDTKKWTKNPLVVKRVKRSDKLKQAEKRFSATENVLASRNRDSFASQGNGENRNRVANVSVKNAGSKDEAGGSKASSKYQKLEQMRKMRLNLSVTSDEENVPQKAPPHRWSGSNIRNFAVTNKDTEPVAHQGAVRSQFGQEFCKAQNSPPVLVQQSYLPTSHNTQSSPRSSLYHTRPHDQLIVAKTSSSVSSVNASVGIQPRDLAPGQTTSRLNYSQTQFSGHFPEPNAPSSRQTFYPLSNTAGPENASYKTPEMNSSRSNPAVFGNSPNVFTNRFTSQVKVPFNDPAADYRTSATTSHPLLASQNTPYFTPRQILPEDGARSVTDLRLSSYTTAGLETKRTSTSANDSKSQQKLPRKIMSRSGMLEGHDDSLDELVESNIQYLSSDAEKVQPKRSSANSVIRFSSLPEHGKIASRVLSKSNTAPQTHPSIQVQANTSIHLHVTLPAETPRLGTSLIQTAPSADSDHHSIYGFRNQLTSQPDLIPKNFPQDVYSPLSQTRNDYNSSKQSVTRTAGQLGGRVAPTSQPTFGTAHTRLGFGDKKPRSDTEISLQPAKLDKGMFSDAEYDIEVSERVKKWETLLKVREAALKSDKKDLITVNENADSDTFMPPASDTHKAVVPSKPSRFVSSYADESTNQATVPRVMSLETNARRFFQVLPDARMNIQAHDVSNRLFPTPLSLRPEKTFTSASELRQQVLASRVHPLPVTAGPVQVTYKPPFPGESGQQGSLYKDTSYTGQHGSPYKDTSYTGQQGSPYKDASYSGQQASPYSDSSYSGQLVSSQKETPVVRRISNKDDVRNPEKRGSKYREELNEISCIKSDSVGNLRRRFDTDSTNATSEDDKKSVSTASAKLSVPSKEYSSQNESTDWSQVLPNYNTRLRDSEVWSPNLESTQGVPVSIERVTARTLRTIPFSEDPFWKEIEQMTSFDPTNREAMLAAEPVRSHHQVQLIPQQSFTLPTQPHRNVTSVVDKLQKSKSLYTPNIAPLAINVNSRSTSNAATALDDVLNDINRSPRKLLSPKKKSFEVDSSPTNVATSDISRFLKTRPNSGQFGKSENGKSEYGQPLFTYPGTDGNAGSTQTLESGLRGLHRLDMSTTRQQQQPLQFSQLPRQPNTQHRQAQPSQGFTNNYQLDVNLLKQKLLNTGLAEAETEEIVDQGRYQNPSLGRPTYNSTTIRSITGQPYSSVASKPIGDAHLEKPSTWSQNLNKSNISTTSKNIFLTQPQKQPGSKTLDEIQKALAPFSSTTYRPDPETLYGVSKLQAFQRPTCDTSVGPHTSATGWSYHTDLNTDMERSNTVDSSLSAGSSRLQEVNESMDDLTNLARGVELRISEIKNKLQSADETSLDQILLSLKKLTPEIKSQQTDTATFENYYENKKSKLSDALSELDRIYTSLELNTDSANTLHKQDKPQSDLPSFNVPRPQPKSVHLRPMQTRISSVFIRDLDAIKMSDNNLEKESEFDVISKSFQAIVDEVNLTTDLLSRAVERSRQDNMTPEAHKQVSNPTVKPGNIREEHVVTANSDTVTCAQNSNSHMLNTSNQKSAEITNTVSSPPSSAQQLRFRPVKDNKIIQEDKATKKDCEEKVFKVLTSPKPSPTLIRKLFNEDQVSQTKPHFSSHDHLMKQNAEVKLAPLQITVKVEPKHLECQDACKPVKPSPASYENNSSEGSNRAETLMSESSAGIKSSTSLPLASKSEADQLSAAVQTADVSKTADGNTASRRFGLSSVPSATTVSSVFVPTVGSSKLSKHVVAGTTSDQSDSTSKNGNKTKRHVGSGVAMMLGRFSSSQESIDGSKKSASTRAGDKDGSGEETTDKEHAPVKTPPIDPSDSKVTSDANLKSPIRSSTKGKPIHNFDMKPTNPSSLERKLVDPEAKLLNSGASSPQPSSPVNKPPQSPWKRHTSDPEKQSVADAIKAYSPKFVSKIPRPASSNGSTASDGYFTPKELDSPRQVVGSPGIATSKERPPVWKSPAVSPRARGRPHSFHELISVFEKDSSDKLLTFDKFRKSASAGEVSSNECLVSKGFRFQKMVPEETTTEK